MPEGTIAIDLSGKASPQDLTAAGTKGNRVWGFSYVVDATGPGSVSIFDGSGGRFLGGIAGAAANTGDIEQMPGALAATRGLYVTFVHLVNLVLYVT